MAEMSPAIHDFEYLAGPFFDSDGVAQWLSIGVDDVEALAVSGDLIGCQLENAQWVFPEWQFTDHGAVHPALLTVWGVLRGAADPWTCAAWMCTETYLFEGLSAVQAVAAGDIERVLACARDDAAGWAG
ncbi:hypothetical protein IEU95_00695 [Hoyosella rhizosphaerae]|nr:hypothetical protein [Hoyosella rhizosphaerae]MBN4925338.1 hypothetical protein [Hoyosella rhizosphaerae]